MVEVQAEFKDRLDIAMKLRDIKPVELARRLGIKESTISQYRSGYSKPKRNRLVEIANVLMVDPSWLMGLDVPMLRRSTRGGELTKEEEAIELDVINASMLIERMNPDNRKRVLHYMENLYQVQTAEEATKH